MPILEASGTRIYYEVVGEGRPLIFVHGLFMNHNTWRHIVASVRDEYQAVSYDLRGHGGTPKGDCQVTVEQLVRDLRAFVLKMGFKQPVLIGYSVGALTSLLYAIEYPDDVSGLIVSGAFTTSYRRIIQMDLKLSKLASRFHLKGLLANIIAKAHATSGTEFRLFVHLIKQCNLQACREIIESVEGLELDYDLSRIQAPTLLIYGSHERLAFQKEIDRLMERIPNCKRSIVKGVSHAVLTKKHEEFSACLKLFLHEHDL